MVRTPRIVAGLLLAALVMTACSSGGKRVASTDSGTRSSDPRTSGSSSAASPSSGSNTDVNSAGDIPDNQVFVVFTFAPGPYTVKVPEGWSRTNEADGSVRFADNYNTIELHVAPSPSPPSEQSALASELPGVQAAVQGFEFHNVSTITRKSGPAVVMAYNAVSSPNSVTGKAVPLTIERYEFWKTGIEAIVTLSGPVNADNVDPWRTVTDSFRVVMTPILTADGLYRFFHDGDEEVVALAGVSIRVEPGEVVAVLGPSGSGKTTLLACLGGLDEPDGGTVVVCDRQMSRRRERERARLRADLVGVLFQSRNLFDHLTIDGNIALARAMTRGRRHQLGGVDVLDRLGLAHRRASYPRDLSGGETARAALAVACANEPRLLLADEPTGEVDSVTARSVVALLRSRADEGAGVVVVTHSDAIARVADNVIHLRDGKVIA